MKAQIIVMCIHYICKTKVIHSCKMENRIKVLELYCVA